MKIELWTVAVSSALIIACTSNKNTNNDHRIEDIAPSVTKGVEHISAVSATLKGKANLGSTISPNITIGFQYSKAAGILPSNAVVVEVNEADADYNYTGNITGLDPETTYYFRSFVFQDDHYIYGETKEFTTKKIASMLETLEAIPINERDFQVRAKLDLTDVLYSSITFGFYWGASEEVLDGESCNVELFDNYFTSNITKLRPKTQYWYKSFVTIDSRTFCGEVKTFTSQFFNPYENTVMVFSINVGTINGNNASISVEHNASQMLSWYACLTEDLESPLENVVKAVIENLTADKLYTTTFQSFYLSGLEGKTDYRFIAFGIEIEDNSMIWTYGTPADVTFKTKQDYNVIFSISQPIVEKNSATFTVSYDKAEDDELTWYGFLTTDISSSAVNVIKKEVKNIPASKLKSGKDVKVTLENLDFSTNYRYIVVGLLANRNLYGTPAEARFQTGEM